MTKLDLRNIGPRFGTLQIVPPRAAIARPLSVPEKKPAKAKFEQLFPKLGPGAAAGLRNVGKSQIARPRVTNVYVGPFWGDAYHFEEFSRAIVEQGYLDPLWELGYGAGSGTYIGALTEPSPGAGDFTFDAARRLIGKLIETGHVVAGDDSVLMLILANDLVATWSDGKKSGEDFEGYHDYLHIGGSGVAYAALPCPTHKTESHHYSDLMAAYSHELVEVVTDKIPGQGWVDGRGYELADLEAWDLYYWGPERRDEKPRFVVQSYYTRERGPTIGAWREKAPSRVGTLDASEGGAAISTFAPEAARARKPQRSLVNDIIPAFAASIGQSGQPILFDAPMSDYVRPPGINSIIDWADDLNGFEPFGRDRVVLPRKKLLTINTCGKALTVITDWYEAHGYVIV